MNSLTLPLPKKRIDVIDALRGLALMGILLLHSIEHFELYVNPETSNEALQWLNQTIWDTTFFIFSGKSYAIFSLLFGLSFFIQMENQADRGIDFRLRFAWRLVLLYGLGYLNGLFYQGEIFAVYAVFGLLLIPLYNVPNRWLWVLCLAFLGQLPALIRIGQMIADPDTTSGLVGTMRESWRTMFKESTEVYRDGSFADMIAFNSWTGHLQKWITMFIVPRWTHICGLFIGGMLIGRYGIHKDEAKMQKYAGRGLGIGLVLFVAFYCLHNMLPRMGIENDELVRLSRNVTKSYYNLGLMLFIIGVFIAAYFRLGARKTLDRLAPVGRMSVTNYMSQAVIGATIFYGYGLGLAVQCGSLVSLGIGIVFFSIQAALSAWWLKRYYYGPMEWLWRSLTWMKPVPLKRATNG